MLSLQANTGEEDSSTGPIPILDARDGSLAYHPMLHNCRGASVNELMDRLLLLFGDLYEFGNSYGQPVPQSSRYEFEPLRKCLAILLAEDSLETADGGMYRFTAKGYMKYAPRIKVVRSLSDRS